MAFLIILKSLIISFFWIWFIVKVYIYYLLCSYSSTILWKNLVPVYRPKCSVPIRLQNFEINLDPDWYKFMKTKSWFKSLWACMVKNGCDHHPDHRTLKLPVSQDWIDGMTVLCMLIQILESYNLLQWFLCGHNQKSLTSPELTQLLSLTCVIQLCLISYKVPVILEFAEFLELFLNFIWFLNLPKNILF